MKSEEDRPVGKIGYEKPTAIDLGPAAPVVGGSCAGGGTNMKSTISACSWETTPLRGVA